MKIIIRALLVAVLLQGSWKVTTVFAGGPDCTTHPDNPNCVQSTPVATEPAATNPPGACGPSEHDENGTCVENGGGNGDEGNPCPPGEHEDGGACVPNGDGAGNGCQNQGNGNGEEDQGGGVIGCDTATPPPTDPCIENPESCVTPTLPPVCTENCEPVPSPTPVVVTEENHPPKTGAGDFAGLGFAFAQIIFSAGGLTVLRNRKPIQFK